MRPSPAVRQRNSLPRKLPRADFAAAFSAAECPPAHHCVAGTDALTCATWLPQPDHVVFPHVVHFTA